MGGSGSGTWYRWDVKRTIEQTKRFDIRYFKKRGMLHTGSYVMSWNSSHDGETTGSVSINLLSGKGMIVGWKFENSTTGIQETMEIVVRFTQTTCAYSGVRQWFICPNCQRRVGILILYPPTVVCRHCLNLTYSCQNEHAMYRALRRRNKIGDRIGIRDSFDSYSGNKPKWMHWATFHRLRDEYENADESSEVSFANRYSGRFS